MTLPEICLALESPDDRRVHQSPEEMQRAVAAWRSMTARERLLSRRR